MFAHKWEYLITVNALKFYYPIAIKCALYVVTCELKLSHFFLKIHLHPAIFYPYEALWIVMSDSAKEIPLLSHSTNLLLSVYT